MSPDSPHSKCLYHLKRQKKQSIQKIILATFFSKNERQYALATAQLHLKMKKFWPRSCFVKWKVFREFLSSGQCTIMFVSANQGAQNQMSDTCSYLPKNTLLIGITQFLVEQPKTTPLRKITNHS